MQNGGTASRPLLPEYCSTTRNNQWQQAAPRAGEQHKKYADNENNRLRSSKENKLVQQDRSASIDLALQQGTKGLKLGIKVTVERKKGNRDYHRIIQTEKT